MCSYWIDDEFKNIDFNDSRLFGRIKSIIQNVYNAVNLPFSLIHGSHADLIGTYRFLSNPKIHYSIILNEHSQKTIERLDTLKQVKTVLAIQDTTSIDLTNKTVAKDLGCLERERDKGLFFHPTIFITPDELPLGIAHTKVWSRSQTVVKVSAYHKRLNNINRPLEEKETFRWLQSFRYVNKLAEKIRDKQFVSIGDRESDFIEILSEACHKDAKAKILIRAAHDRRTKAAQLSEQNKSGKDIEINKLWDRVADSPVKYKSKVSLVKTKKREARNTTLEIRCEKVTIVPPRPSHIQEEFFINAVYVKEVNDAVDTADLIDWMLLTTLPVNTEQQVTEVISYYKSRWKIEVFFRLLKTGCKVESHNFKTVDAYMNCFAIKMICAWRIMYLDHVSKKDIQIDPEILFSEIELDIIRVKSKKKKLETSRDYIRALASMGGFTGGKNKEPGYIYIGYGYMKLSGISEYVEIQRQKQR